MRNKLTKKTTTNPLLVVNFADELGDLLIDTINSITVDAAITITNEAVTSEDVDVDGVGVVIGQGIQFNASGGDNDTEYTITFDFDDTEGTNYTVDVVLLVANSPIVKYYGSVTNADEYFTYRPGSDDWTDATTSEKLKVLIFATRVIDQLNFAGDKNDEDQLLAFPRDEETLIPDDIVFASYEEAISLLSADEDPNIVQSGSTILSESLGTAKVSYDQDSVLENQRSGISSSIAWSLLLPYLRDNREITLVRVN